MLVLLPPSETKLPGGTGAPWDAEALLFPALVPLRERSVAALAALSADEDNAARVLKLSARQRGEIAVNAELRSSPTMPAVDRYTGVLFDALDAASLDADERAWLGRNVAVHSAPFGPVGALDPIPRYRLGAGISLPGLGSLKKLWAEAVTDSLAAHGATFVLDLRSEAYVGLGPVPADLPSAYVRVVARGADGTTRALNHFNKKAKGELVRALARSGAKITSAAGFVRWAHTNGWEAAQLDGEIELVTEQIVMSRR